MAQAGPNPIRLGGNCCEECCLIRTSSLGRSISDAIELLRKDETSVREPENRSSSLEKVFPLKEYLTIELLCKEHRRTS